MTDRKLIVIVGPTASGKTALAIQLARRLGTEIVSADSRQIFKEMNIGTAKPSEAELSEIRHHFINTHSMAELYDAAQYGQDALKVIYSLFESHAVVILCGGSGLYVKAVCEGFDDIPDVPADVRQRLMERYRESGLPWLQEKMKELDPDYYEAIDKQNPQRLIRALEVRIGTGRSIADYHTRNKPGTTSGLVHPFSVLKIGLELERDELYKRIDDRMEIMISEGLFEEASRLYPLRSYNALQTVGYKEIFDYMDGRYDREEAVRLLKRNSRRYAKRQLTWFKRDKDIRWFHPSSLAEIHKLVLADVS